MALQYAVYLYNKTPRMDTWRSPEEFWTRTTCDHASILSNLHTWGCPAYVLDPSLQNGHKIPKWQPRLRQAQYLDVFPLHASTVRVVRNLRTGRLSPQFHLVFDDFFEPVHSESSSPLHNGKKSSVSITSHHILTIQFILLSSMTSGLQMRKLKIVIKEILASHPRTNLPLESHPK